jgi:hypothetical protein
MVDHLRGGIDREATVLYAAIRSDWVADVKANGLRRETTGYSAGYVLLLETENDAYFYGMTCFGEDEDQLGGVVAVNVSPYGADQYEDFWDVRKGEMYCVFGRHTYLRADIPPERLTWV